MAARAKRRGGPCSRPGRACRRRARCCCWCRAIRSASTRWRRWWPRAAGRSRGAAAGAKQSAGRGFGRRRLARRLDGRDAALLRRCRQRAARWQLRPLGGQNLIEAAACGCPLGDGAAHLQLRRGSRAVARGAGLDARGRHRQRRAARGGWRMTRRAPHGSSARAPCGPHRGAAARHGRRDRGADRRRDRRAHVVGGMFNASRKRETRL